LTIQTRKTLLAINNCIYNYGRYIEAFKQGFVYSLTRINMKEQSESLDLVGKEELEEDEKHKLAELSHLGLLAKVMSGTALSMTSNNTVKPNVKKDDSTINFIAELHTIDERVKQECQKIYTGEYSKIINNPDKITPSLVPFLQGLKQEMENFRLKCIRDLRTFVRHTLNTLVPESI
jgi:hypothetical protein